VNRKVFARIAASRLPAQFRVVAVEQYRVNEHVVAQVVAETMPTPVVRGDPRDHW